MPKRLEFCGNSIEAVRAFPAAARRDIGHELWRVQDGEEPLHWKPMNSVGAGVREIRVRDAARIYRAIYIATLPESVYVLHAFVKKTQKTPKTDIDLAKNRLTELMRKGNRP
jgi:phage-related protein